LFAGTTARERLHIASIAYTRTFARGDILCMQGDPTHSLMMIQHGSAKLTQVSTAGSEVILWIASRCDLVGVHTTSARLQHTCTARALEPCSTLCWDYSRLGSLLEEYPVLRANLNEILARRVRELEERFREVATERVANRLALTLLRLVKHVGQPHGAGVMVSLTRQELAQLSGTTLFTASRVLSQWDETGILLARRHAVVVTNITQLQCLAEAE